MPRFAAAAGGLGVHLALVADAAAYGPLLSAKLFIAVVLGGAVAPAGGLVGVAVLALLGRLVELGGLEGQQAARLETLLVALIVVAAGARSSGASSSFSDWRRQRGRPGPLRRHRPGAGRGRFCLSVAVEARADEALRRGGGSEDVNVDVPPATVHALIGPNGSGKTTALRVLAGWIEPDAGTVAVVGGRRDDVVGTLQATSVFSELTVLENALVGAHRGARHRGVGRTLSQRPRLGRRPAPRKIRAHRALETVGLGHLADVLAHELPGNAQRRLMIATALAAEPRVLLLDEPSAGADRGEVDVLADLVGNLRESGFTVVLVEHNLRLVRRVADRVTVLAAGRSIAEARSPRSRRTKRCFRRISVGTVSRLRECRGQSSSFSRPCLLRARARRVGDAGRAARHLRQRAVLRHSVRRRDDGPGAELGARHVNDRGLNVGGQPYELRIERVDNRLSPQAAVANVRRAVADDAVAVVDEGTGVNASWRIAAEADVPLGITFQGGIGLVDPARPNVFRIAPNDHGLAFRLAEYLIPKGEKLALLVDDSGYGQEGKKALEQAFRGQESVVARIDLPASATDVAPQVLRARRAGATGLLVWAQAPAISATITAARSAGWDVPIYAASGADPSSARSSPTNQIGSTA